MMVTFAGEKYARLSAVGCCMALIQAIESPPRLLLTTTRVVSPLALLWEDEDEDEDDDGDGDVVFSGCAL